NGISLLIFAGIVVRLPSAVTASYTLMTTGELKLFVFVIILAAMVAVTAAVVLMQEGQRKIPVQYAKRVVGRRVYGGQSTHIPLRINTAGVIPVIFASSLILFPATLTRFFPHPWMQAIADALSPGRFTYTLLYMGLIVFFAYFYTAIVFNPIDLADNMKKYGGFIPGVRPGKKTAESIDRTLTRLTLPRATCCARRSRPGPRSASRPSALWTRARSCPTRSSSASCASGSRSPTPRRGSSWTASRARSPRPRRSPAS